MGPTNILIALLFLSIAVGSAAAILAWRERPKPGSVPLVALLFGQNWWSIAIVFRLQSEGLSTKLFWNNLAWIGVVIIPIGWLIFSIEYAGGYEDIKETLTRVLGIVPIITILLVLIWPYQELIVVEEAVVGNNGVLMIRYGGLWYIVTALYTYLLGVAGFFIMLRVIGSQLIAFRKQALAVFIGMLFPYLANLLYLADILPHLGIDPTPIAFSVTGVTFLFAIRRYELLTTSPAANKRARQLVFNRMQEGIIVVDENNKIVDINKPARKLLKNDSKAVLGSDAGAMVPKYERIPYEGTFNEILTINSESEKGKYRVESIPIQSGQDAAIGRVISFTDVTEFIRQQQRLSVLNRVLRHNIRTETNVILGHAEQLGGEEGQMIKNRALEIDRLGEKGRRAIELFDNAYSEAKPQRLQTMIRGAIESANGKNPNATIEFDEPKGTLLVSNIIDSSLKNAIENAVVHAESEDQNVQISVQKFEEEVHISIRDDGPGISDYELSVLRSGTETDLKHGSGLGLWIIKWGVDLANGIVEFERNDLGGTTVRIEAPLLEKAGEE